MQLHNSIDSIQANVYGLASQNVRQVSNSGETGSTERTASPYLTEYTLDTHRRRYQPVAHILLKQEMYLAGFTKYNQRASHPTKTVATDVEQ